MSAVLQEPGPELSEPVPALEVFVSGLDRIEPVGGNCFRFVLYSGQDDRMVVLRVVAPVAAFPDAIIKMLRVVVMLDACTDALMTTLRAIGQRAMRKLM